MPRTLIILGLAIAVIGLLWPWIGRTGLGRLPGDIFIQRDNFTFYAPIAMGILVSVVLSLMRWLLSRKEGKPSFLIGDYSRSSSGRVSAVALATSVRRVIE
jgi:hypothetical protein